MPNTHVTLFVDTKAIEYDTSDKFEDSVLFHDNRNGKPGNGRKFKSIINRGKKIIWKGKVNGLIWDEHDADFAGDSVDVIKVEHASGAHLLEYAIYTGTNMVVGDVKDNDETGIEYYKITIKVTRGGTSTEYTIDPKMHK